MNSKIISWIIIVFTLSSCKDEDIKTNKNFHIECDLPNNEFISVKTNWFWVTNGFLKFKDANGHEHLVSGKCHVF